MPKHVEFAALGGPEVLSFVEADPAPPADTEVRIAMKAAGLNRAELLFMAGRYLVEPQLPSRIGFEGAGEVMAVGAGVDRFVPGDRVAVTPAFKQDVYRVLGQVVNIPASALEPIFEGVGYTEAAGFWMAYGTAYGILVQAGGLRDGGGQVVVVNAASSSLGTAAFQIVRAHGGISIATTRDVSKASGLKEAGADHVIVTGAENVSERIMDLTDGKGFDIACDAVGGVEGDALAQAAGLGSTMVVYGRLAGDPAPVPFVPMLGRGLTLSGFHLSWSMLDHPERRKAAVAHLNAGLASGVYAPKIDSTFGLDAVADAYRHMASNTQLGKIILEFSS